MSGIVFIVSVPDFGHPSALERQHRQSIQINLARGFNETILDRLGQTAKVDRRAGEFEQAPRIRVRVSLLFEFPLAGLSQPHASLPL